jgi:hypothetical protein
MNGFEPVRTLPAIGRGWRAGGPVAAPPPDAPVRRVDPDVAREIAQWFLNAPALDGQRLVTDAYRELQAQTDRRFAELTDPHGAFGYSVAWTRQTAPYADAAELIDAVRTTGGLGVTAARVDRDRLHPGLDCADGGPYDRRRRPNCMPSTASRGPPGISPSTKRFCSHDDCCGSVADRCTRASRGSLQVAYATLRRVNAFAAEIRGMPMLARWATLGVLFAGVTGGIVGLIVGLVAYAPTAPFAAVELGFPAALAGGVVGLVAGLTAATASRIRRHAASLEAPGSAGRAREAQDG